MLGNALKVEMKYAVCVSRIFVHFLRRNIFSVIMPKEPCLVEHFLTRILLTTVDWNMEQWYLIARKHVSLHSMPVMSLGYQRVTLIIQKPWSFLVTCNIISDLLMGMFLINLNVEMLNKNTIYVNKQAPVLLSVILKH